MRREKLGVVGVDSGQLMICDPCYIGSSWEEQDFEDRRVFRDVRTGALFEYGVDFEHFEDPVAGRTPNQWLNDGSWEAVPYEPPPGQGWGYNTVSHGTIAGRHQVSYALGGPGLAVAFSSGYGDGLYEVWAEILSDEETGGWGERIAKVEIIMIDEEEYDG